MSLGGLLVAVARPRPCPPPPLRTFFFFPRPVVCLFPGRGVCRRVRGVSSSELSAAVWSWWAALSDRASSGCLGCSFGVLLAGHVGVAHGVARPGGGLSTWALGVCGFAVVWLSLPLSSVPPGWRVCVPGVGRAVRPFPIHVWVGFPPFPVVLVFLRGGGCLFLPLPSLSMHWLVSGVLNWLAVCVAGGRGLCPCSVRLVA